MKILHVFSNTIVLLLSAALPFFATIPYSVIESFLIFFAGLNIFTLIWSFGGLHFVVRWGSVLGILLYSTSLISVHENILVFALFLMSFYLVCFNRHTSNWICSAKTIFFDWLILVLILIGCGFGDIIFRTDTFVSALACFFGSNIFALATVKGSQFMWELACKVGYVPQDHRNATCIFTLFLDHSN